MDKDNDKDNPDIVPEAEETTPAPKHIPPVVHTDPPEDDVKAIVRTLAEKVEALTETVSHIADKGEADSVPTKKPWTHWGSNR
jgi:hypothetical protein